MELADTEVDALGTHGFFARASFLGPSLAQAVHAEAAARVAAGGLQPAGVRRGALRALEPASRQDLTGWLEPAAAGPALRALWEAFEQLGEALSRTAWLGLGRFDVQLAHYPGGGARYVRHLDAFAGTASRRVTAIYYANPRWEEAHGGQLRLHLPAGPLDVAPTLDRLVVFLSERLEHEVLPAHAPRLALTAWYYGRGA